MKTFPIISYLVIVLMYACHDDQVAPTREDFLSGGVKESSKQWQLTQVIKNNIEYTSKMDECELDNIFTFYSNKQYSEVDNNLRCSRNEGKYTVHQGRWEFNLQKTELTVYQVDSVVIDIIIIYNDLQQEIDRQNVYRVDEYEIQKYLVDEVLKDKIRLTYKDEDTGDVYKITLRPLN